MYKQIDKVRHAVPCEAELKAPYTQQASHINYVNAMPDVSRSSPMSHAGRRTKFAPLKSLDSSEFSDLRTL